MKKVLYSALAITAAIAGVAATKANNNNSHRSPFSYRYIGPLPVNQASFVTNTANWTLASFSCTTGNNACGVTATIPVTVDGTTPSAKIPVVQTVFGVNPRFAAAIGTLGGGTGTHVTGQARQAD